MSDKPTTTPVRPGVARMEYLACREDVEDLLAKGYSVRLAYEAMQEQGRVTCGYSAFCDYVRGGGTPAANENRERLFNGQAGRTLSAAPGVDDRVNGTCSILHTIE